MSYSVSGTMITLTRGDTFSALITIADLNVNQYIPMNGERRPQEKLILSSQKQFLS